MEAFPRYWPFVRGIHRSPFPLISAWLKNLGWWYESPSRSLWRHCNVVCKFGLIKWLLLFKASYIYCSYIIGDYVHCIPGGPLPVAIYLHQCHVSAMYRLIWEVELLWWRHDVEFYRPFVRGIHWSLLDSPHKVPWSGALVFYLLWTGTWLLTQSYYLTRMRDFMCNTYQRTHDEILTSLWRRYDVGTSFWRHNDIIIASCSCWDILSLDRSWFDGLAFYIGIHSHS